MKTYSVTLRRGNFVCNEQITTNPFGLLIYRMKMSKLWDVTVNG